MADLSDITMLTYIEESPAQMTALLERRDEYVGALVDAFCAGDYASVWLVACGFFIALLLRRKSLPRRRNPLLWKSLPRQRNLRLQRNLLRRRAKKAQRRKTTIPCSENHNQSCRRRKTDRFRFF